MDDPLYLECACYYCRLMRVQYDPEFGETFISMWSRPTSFPWLTRLRHIWKIPTGGEPFEDEIIEEYYKLKHR